MGVSGTQKSMERKSLHIFPCSSQEAAAREGGRGEEEGVSGQNLPGDTPMFLHSVKMLQCCSSSPYFPTSPWNREMSQDCSLLSFFYLLPRAWPYNMDFGFPSPLYLDFLCTDPGKANSLSLGCLGILSLIVTFSGAMERTKGS